MKGFGAVLLRTALRFRSMVLVGPVATVLADSLYGHSVPSKRRIVFYFVYWFIGTALVVLWITVADCRKMNSSSPPPSV